MKNKYLIQWRGLYEGEYWEEYSDSFRGHSLLKVGNFTDEELEKFCKNKYKIKVTFVCNIPEIEEDLGPK